MNNKKSLLEKLDIVKKEQQQLSIDFIAAQNHYEEFYRDYEAPQKEFLLRSVNDLDLYNITPAHLIEDKLKTFLSADEDYIKNMRPDEKIYAEYYANAGRKRFFGGQEIIDLFGEYWNDGTENETFAVGDSYYTEYSEKPSFDQNNLYPYPLDTLNGDWKNTVFEYSPKTLQNTFIFPCSIADVDAIPRARQIKNLPILARRRLRVENYDLISLISDKDQTLDLNPENIYPCLSKDSGDHFKYKRLWTTQNTYVTYRKGRLHNLSDLLLLMRKRELAPDAPELIYNTVAICSEITVDPQTTTLCFKDPTKEITLDLPNQKGLDRLKDKICAISFYFPRGEDEFFPLCIQMSNIPLQPTNKRFKNKTKMIDLRKEGRKCKTRKSTSSN